MTNTTPTTREEMIEMLNNKLAESRRSLEMLSNVLLGQGYIVVSSADIALTFTVENGVATSPKVSAASKAIRFSRRDAESVAANVTDGWGRAAHAEHVTVAIKREIASLEACVAGLAR